jgi:hypothetical protein
LKFFEKTGWRQFFQAGDIFPGFFGPPGARKPAWPTFKGIPLFCDAGLFI